MEILHIRPPSNSLKKYLWFDGGERSDQIFKYISSLFPAFSQPQNGALWTWYVIEIYSNSAHMCFDEEERGPIFPRAVQFASFRLNW